jgi:hypothetical protein
MALSGLSESPLPRRFRDSPGWRPDHPHLPSALAASAEPLLLPASARFYLLLLAIARF